MALNHAAQAEAFPTVVCGWWRVTLWWMSILQSSNGAADDPRRSFWDAVGGTDVEELGFGWSFFAKGGDENGKNAYGLSSADALVAVAETPPKSLDSPEAAVALVAAAVEVALAARDLAALVVDPVLEEPASVPSFSLELPVSAAALGKYGWDDVFLKTSKFNLSEADSA